MPWLHFHLGTKGQVNACCVSSIKYGNINNNSLEEIWNSSSINEVRTKFLTGEADNRCSVCINREKAGAKSMRQETFEKFPDFDIVNSKKPIYFDIRFSNVCNFKCRTCWHGASSKWFNEAKKLKTTAAKSAIIKNIGDINRFMNQNGHQFDQAQEFYFAGGEPLVTEEHYILLDFLIRKKITNVKLRYNTNFSILNFKQYDILNYWKQFKQVEILASIDESHQLGEYIRKELSWNKFLENRDKIKGLENLNFKISPTVSVFNIKSLPEFYKLCVSQNVIQKKDIYINILDRPFYYSSKVLNIEDKHKNSEIYADFFNWCRDNEIPNDVIQQFKGCVDFMNAENLHQKYWSTFQRLTNQLDDLRSENYITVKK